MARLQHVVLVGGGLANSLIALRLAARRSDVSFEIRERGANLGGPSPHTWCCHQDDVSAEAWTWLSSLAETGWQGYDVVFPDFARTFDRGYLALSSQHLQRTVERLCGDRLHYGEGISTVHPGGVRTDQGHWRPASLVIDGRGHRPVSPCGYQIFHGKRVRTSSPHGLVRPLLMDATVPQLGGYRFVYALPLAADVLLVEDTRYSDEGRVDEGKFAVEIAAYLSRRGWQVAAELGSETGSLPIPLLATQRPNLQPGIVTAGVAAGLYHPTTGYSLGAAVRFADWLCEQPVLTYEAVCDAAAAFAQQHWQQGAFFRRLNNMLFFAGEASQRRQVMAQFYRRSPALIRRFYRGDLRWHDCLRLVMGRPPVPLAAGLAAFVGRPWLDSDLDSGAIERERGSYG